MNYRQSDFENAVFSDIGFREMEIGKGILYLVCDEIPKSDNLYNLLLKIPVDFKLKYENEQNIAKVLFIDTNPVVTMDVPIEKTINNYPPYHLILQNKYKFISTAIVGGIEGFIPISAPPIPYPLVIQSYT
jgi:hypothetical protein